MNYSPTSPEPKTPPAAGRAAFLALGSEFKRLRGVDLPRGDLARFPHQGLHLGIAIHRLLDLAEPGPVLGGDEHSQGVRLLPPIRVTSRVTFSPPCFLTISIDFL